MKTNKTDDIWTHISLKVFLHNMEITGMNDDISKFFWSVPVTFFSAGAPTPISSTMLTYVRFACSANFWKYRRYLTIVDASLAFAGIGGKYFS